MRRVTMACGWADVPVDHPESTWSDAVLCFKTVDATTTTDATAPVPLLRMRGVVIRRHDGWITASCGGWFVSGPSDAYAVGDTVQALLLPSPRVADPVVKSVDEPSKQSGGGRERMRMRTRSQSSC